VLALGAEMGEPFAKGLKSAAGIEADSLDLSGKLGGDPPTVLRVVAQFSRVLKELNLSFNRIGPTGATALADALKVNGVLTDLTLAGNKIRDQGAAAIAEALRGNGVLNTLNLSRNNIGGGTGWIKASEVEGESKEVGAKVIYQGREMVVSVGVDKDGDLKLEDPTGVIAIAKALEVNRVLTTLDLVNNQIREQGAAAIAEALRGNGVLTELDLADNDIGDKGATALASALEVNGVLTTLDLRLNYNIGDEGKKAIQDAVSGREGFKLMM